MASAAETSTNDENGNVENGPLNPKTTVEAEEGIEMATESEKAASAEGTSAAAPAAAPQAAAKRFYLVRVPKPFANAELTKEVATLEAKCEAMRQNVKMTNEAIRFKKMKKQNARGSAALTPHPPDPPPHCCKFGHDRIVPMRPWTICADPTPLVSLGTCTRT